MRVSMATKTKKRAGDLAYSVNDCIVYPAHGVGRILGVEKQVIAGFDMEVYVISFEQDICRQKPRSPTFW